MKANKVIATKRAVSMNKLRHIGLNGKRSCSSVGGVMKRGAFNDIRACFIWLS